MLNVSGAGCVCGGDKARLNMNVGKNTCVRRRASTRCSGGGDVPKPNIHTNAWQFFPGGAIEASPQ